MAQARSSTSSSERPRSRRVRDAIVFVAGVVAALVAFECVVAACFSMSGDDREPEGALVRYFSYGYSTEAKLDRSIGVVGQEPTPIIRAGWIPTALDPPPDSWKDAPLRVVFYGMSFTGRVADQLAEARPTYAISSRGGPAAPFNHSYALFEADPWRPEADVVVVGLLSSSIPYLGALTGLGFTPESPAPYTFPRFSLVAGELKREDPVIIGRDQFVEAFRTRSPLWRAHIESLEKNDVYWDPFVFSSSFLDHSALVRLARRAWASRRINIVRDRVYSPDKGYDTQDPSLAAVPVMLRAMQEACRRNGQQLIVLLLHARGEPGHLKAWLAGDLAVDGIATISTTDLFSSTDALNFARDSHYIPKLDARIAEAVDRVIRSTPHRHH